MCERGEASKIKKNECNLESNGLRRGNMRQSKKDEITFSETLTRGRERRREKRREGEKKKESERN